MPTANTFLSSFNAGVFSPLMAGQVSFEKYRSSLNLLENAVTTPQGPIVRRSGTEFLAPVYNEAKKSALVPFTYTDEDALDVELAEGRCRFILDEGLQTYTAVAVTAVSGTTSFVITAAGLGASIGDQVALAGWANLPAAFYPKVTAVSGADFTLDIANPGVTLAGGETAARVFHILNTFVEADFEGLSSFQDQSYLYIFSRTKRPKRLLRQSDFVWTLDDLPFKDGPFEDINATATTVTLAAAPNPIPLMTSNTAPSGEAYSDPVSLDAYKAFDRSDTTLWQSGTNQIGTLGYIFGSGKVINGFTIYISPSSDDADYTNKDYAPSTWSFEASNDGITWTTLQEFQNYVLYENNRSRYFKVDNTASYTRYRLVIKACVRNGPLKPRVAELVLTEAGSVAVTLTASSITGINSGTGFKTTDVGRQIRIKGKDANWRAFDITAFTSTTQVSVTPQEEPYFETVRTTEWRLGLYSDTTGWPTTGVFFDDRLWLAGASGSPTSLAGSKPGAYSVFSPSDANGTVNDDNGIRLVLKARKLSVIRWISTDERSLLVGSGAGEWVVSAASVNEALTARSVRARQSTARGSSKVAPARVDRAILFVQRAGRTVREFAYSFEVDGYRAPSMSLFASHLGASKFVELDYAAEPHSIVWVRREDGTIAGLTYNREENVVSWHPHSTKNGSFESMAIRTSKASDQDMMTFIVRRTINGQTRRYIERLKPFWDFGAERASAWFVDSGFKFEGAGQIIKGLGHLEGQTINCLVDGHPVKGLVVTNGQVDLGTNSVAEAVVVGGIPILTRGMPSRSEFNAGDGTSQGRLRKTGKIVLRFWDSAGGKIGRMNPETLEIVADDLLTRKLEDLLDGPTKLLTGDIVIDTATDGWDTDSQVYFETEDPLPFNMVAMMQRISVS